VDKSCRVTEWFTPPRVLEPVRKFFAMRPGSGVIDLDPATSPDNPVGAVKWCCEGNDPDGLSSKWHGNVFLNPPYGRVMREQWTPKIHKEAMGGVRIVALLPGQRFETEYWQRDILNPYLSAIVFVRKRVSFCDRAGNPIRNNPYGSMLYVYNATWWEGDATGWAWSDIAQAFSPLGFVLRVEDWAQGRIRSPPR
jgi:hypothetical protein